MNFGQFHKIFYPSNKIAVFIRNIKEPQFFPSTNITFYKWSHHNIDLCTYSASRVTDILIGKK